MTVQPASPTSDEYLFVENFRTAQGLVERVERTDSSGRKRINATTYDTDGIHVASTALRVGAAAGSKRPHDHLRHRSRPWRGARLDRFLNGVSSYFSYDWFGRIRRSNPAGGGGVSHSYAIESVAGTAGAFQIRRTTTVDGGGETATIVSRSGYLDRSRQREMDSLNSIARKRYNDLGLTEGSTLPGKGEPGPETVISYDLARSPQTFSDAALRRPSSTVHTRPARRVRVARGVQDVYSLRWAHRSSFRFSTWVHLDVYVYDEEGRVVQSWVKNAKQPRRRHEFHIRCVRSPAVRNPA